MGLGSTRVNACDPTWHHGPQAPAIGLVELQIGSSRDLRQPLEDGCDWALKTDIRTFLALATRRSSIAKTSSPRLTDHGLDVPEDAALEMYGMLTDEQMAALADAEGAAIDRLFLEGMIQHHEGALEMALAVLSDGEDQRVNELANDVNVSQSAEIARMEALLSSL